MLPSLAKPFSVPSWPYPIGVLGKAWTKCEKVAWRNERTKQHRSYREEVISKLEKSDGDSDSIFDVVCYGKLSHGDYPVYAMKSKSWRPESKLTALITGGVHGYETSGVQGAIQFCETTAKRYLDRFNLVVIPCVSPWGYERIQRWNRDAVDPNRNFFPKGEAEECELLMKFLNTLGVKEWACHVDLHETTDTDVTEFRPAKDAKNGAKDHKAEPVPDGFYLVGNSEDPQPDFYTAIITEVAKVTHIAIPDGEDNTILGCDVLNGCVLVPTKSINLCASVTNAKYSTTTEVYPDSDRASDEICNDAQVAAIRSALDYVASMP